MPIQPNERLGSSGTSGTDNRGVAGQVQSKAEELMERAGEKARSRFDDGKHQAAQELGTSPVRSGGAAQIWVTIVRQCWRRT
jgi:hypothetical protein